MLVRYFPKPSYTSSLTLKVRGALSTIRAAEEQFLNGSFTLSRSQVSMLLNAVARCLDTLQNTGIVLEYELGEQSIYVRFCSGFTLAYAPTVEGTKSGNGDTSVSIVSLQPSLAEAEGWGSDLLLYDKSAQTLTDTFDTYTFSQNLDDGQVTLNAVKSFGPNQVILWDGHGGYESDIHSFLLTGEKFDWWKWATKQSYREDNAQNVTIYCDDQVCITSKFIDKYCGDLSGDLIYLGACESGKDSTLADAFLNKGATAVVANSDLIYGAYDLKMENTIITRMTKVNSKTGNYYTLGEALNVAKGMWGKNDAEWAESQGIETDGTSAEIRIFGGDNARNLRFANKE